MNVWTYAAGVCLISAAAAYVFASERIIERVEDYVRIDTFCQAQPHNFRMVERSALNIRMSYDVSAEIELSNPPRKVFVGDRDRRTELDFSMIRDINVFEDEVIVNIAPGMTRRTTLRFRNVSASCLDSLKLFARSSQEIMRKVR